jgi:hypothetical protein
MRKLAIGVAAVCLTCAAIIPANAQGLWIGAPGFGVGIGVAPTYAYEPYYDGYPMNPITMAIGEPHMRPGIALRAERSVFDLRI